ncbi:MAG: glucokinase [Anaerolineae bacterium]|nr:glucokinase [Anaerolineae bacterium]
MLLAADIGGTKTNLAIVDSERGPRVPWVEATYPSSRYLDLETLVGEFLSQRDLSVDRACFGVAGPVIDGRATITNLPWAMEEAQLAKALRLSEVRLLNDLECIAYAVPLLEERDLCTLNDRLPAVGGAIAVIAPGTGLGEAFLIGDGSRYRACPSEGGHADFAPSNALQLDLLRYLQDVYGHVSCERVCSGVGLPNIYAFLKASRYAEEPAWLADRLSRSADATPIIVGNALDRDQRCDLCVATLDLFVSILGAEAGNLALKVLSTGGVYLGGGIPPRILPALSGGKFMRAFRNKGRFSEMIARIPVHVILDPTVALLGAAAYGLEVLR